MKLFILIGKGEEAGCRRFFSFYEWKITTKEQSYQNAGRLLRCYYYAAKLIK